MAKQVIWSLVAKKQLKEAFQILKLKNGNNEVGEVLYVQLQNILHRISMNPFIGHTTWVMSSHKNGMHGMLWNLFNNICCLFTYYTASA